MNKKIYFIALVFISLVTISAYYGIVKSKTETPPVDKYTAANLPLSFVVPNGYTSTEKNHLVVLRSENNLGDISIHRIATNFDAVDDYIADLAEMNKLKISARSPVVISGKDFRLIEYASGNISKKAYITVQAGWAYTVESTSSETDRDLEAVAMSVEFNK